MKVMANSQFSTIDYYGDITSVLTATRDMNLLAALAEYRDYEDRVYDEHTNNHPLDIVDEEGDVVGFAEYLVHKGYAKFAVCPCFNVEDEYNKVR